MGSSAPVAETPRPLERLVRVGERALALLVLLATGYLLFRPTLPAGPELLPTTGFTRVIFLLIGVPLAVALWRASAPGTVKYHPLLRLMRWALAVVLVGMAVARVTVSQYHNNARALRATRIATAPDAYAASLAPIDAAEWALRLTLHAAADLPASDSLPAIPNDWPFPTGALLGLQHDSSGVVTYWSRTEGKSGVVICHAASTASTATLTAALLTPACATGAAAPDAVVFSPPVRAAAVAAALPTDSIETPWLQHRVDPLRGGTPSGSALPALTAGWRAATRTPVRASASIVGNRVLVGGHATGLVTALDLASGAVQWVARVPNWVHQEPVSDGRTVLVSFGDNRGSFEGRAPSGVAAYSLATGRRLWTRFDESSVMTSPIVRDSTLVYVSADGMVRKRLLANGDLLGKVELSGVVPMGPPVLRGDTLIVTLDPDQACALQASTLKIFWCHHLIGMRMLGHSSAALLGDRAFLSGVGTAVTPSFAEFLQLPGPLQLRLLKALLFPQYTDYNTAAFAGQRFHALSLATGDVIWSSQFFATRRLVDGHTAGTPVIHNGVGVVVLPVADTVVAFDVETGRTLWSSGGHRARGPSLILGEQVLVAGRDGIIELRDLRSGTLTCRVTRPTGFDRAGPAVARGLLIFVTLEGEVEAIPAADILSCTGPGAARS